MFSLEKNQMNGRTIMTDSSAPECNALVPDGPGLPGRRYGAINGREIRFIVKIADYPGWD